MAATNGQHADGFTLLEARHVDALIEVMRALNRSVVHLDEAIRAQTEVMRETHRVAVFDATSISRLEKIETRLEKMSQRSRPPKR